MDLRVSLKTFPLTPPAPPPPLSAELFLTEKSAGAFAPMGLPPKKRRSLKHRSRRVRMEAEGMMLQVDRQWLRSDKAGARGPAASHAVNHRRKFFRLPTRTDLQNRNKHRSSFPFASAKKRGGAVALPFLSTAIVTPLVLSVPATTAAA